MQLFHVSVLLILLDSFSTYGIKSVLKCFAWLLAGSFSCGSASEVTHSLESPSELGHLVFGLALSKMFIPCINVVRLDGALRWHAGAG